MTDGELRRDNFYSFVAEKLSGVRLMTLAEMLDVVEDKAGFEQLLQTLDVPAYSISSPICTARIDRREPLTVDDLAFARRHTDLPIKVTLPGPYLLTRAMFVPELTRAYYPDQGGARGGRRRAPPRGARGAAIRRRGVRPVRRAGADGGRLRARADADVHVRGARRAQGSGRGARVRRLADQRVVAGRRRPCGSALHVCRGNWSRDETTLLSGGYQALRPYLDRLQRHAARARIRHRAGRRRSSRSRARSSGWASSTLAPSRSRRRSRFVRPSKRRSVSIPPNACS